MNGSLNDTLVDRATATTKGLLLKQEIINHMVLISIGLLFFQYLIDFELDMEATVGW